MNRNAKLSQNAVMPVKSHSEQPTDNSGSNNEEPSAADIAGSKAAVDNVVLHKRQTTMPDGRYMIFYSGQKQSEQHATEDTSDKQSN